MPITPDDPVVTIGGQETGVSIDAIEIRSRAITLDVSDCAGSVRTEQVGSDGKITELFWTAGEGSGGKAD